MVTRTRPRLSRLTGRRLAVVRPRPAGQRPLALALGPGFRRVVGGDGYDGDGQGRRFWAVSHCPLGEAPFSAPQARKILGPKCHFTEFRVFFEWVSHGPGQRSSRILWGKLTPVLGITDILPYSTFTGLLPGVTKV